MHAQTQRERHHERDSDGKKAHSRKQQLLILCHKLSTQHKKQKATSLNILDTIMSPMQHTYCPQRSSTILKLRQ